MAEKFVIKLIGDEIYVYSPVGIILNLSVLTNSITDIFKELEKVTGQSNVTFSLNK